MMKRSTYRFFLALALIATAMPGVRAQSASPPEHASPTAPSKNPKADPQGNDSAHDRDEQLSRSPGVIEPPATGDQNIVPSPDVGPNTMPVIPPPGTKGGNPQVEPK